MNRRTIVILGGALSGPAAATRARELDEHARIILVERSRAVSYAQCALAYAISGEVRSLDDFNRDQTGFFESVYGIEVLTETEVVALHPRQHSVTLRSRGSDQRLSYDALVFALGAGSRFPERLPRARNVVSFRTLDDLAAIEHHIAKPGCRVTVIGGGPFGLEAADAMIQRDADVTVVESSARILNGFGLTIGRDAQANLRRHVTLYTSTSIESGDLDGDTLARIHLSGKSVIETDLAIAAIGIEPRTALAREAGIELGSDGTIIVDEMARTSSPDIFACGVCVSVPDALGLAPIWSPQAALADKTAQVAGANAAGAAMRLSPTTSTVLVRVAGKTYGRCGSPTARERARRTLVVAPATEPYMRDACSMLVELLWDERSGRVLGVECAGTRGVDKRIDVVATAIVGGLTIDQLAMLDFGYEPPSNAARDPVNVAATVAMHERDELGVSVFADDLAGIAGAQILDVRDGGEPIDGTRSFPLASLRHRLSELDPSLPVVTVSQTGRRGWIASRILRQRGFAEVMNLAGGMDAWQLLQRTD